MTMPFEAIETEAMKLAPHERALLADRLIDSVSPALEFDAEWHAEVERRFAAIQSGEETLVPVEEALAQARKAIA